jgi:hypothetical protein
MQDWMFMLQLGVVLAAALAIAAWTVGFAFRASRAGAEPIIKASFSKLQAGWYQLQISIANEAPYALRVDELKRVSPRAARLMAPIKQVSTREGEFQVWSHPSTDKATASIPLNFILGPHESRTGAVARASQGQITAWLFLPERLDPTELTVEIVALDNAGPHRRHRVKAKREDNR